MSYTTDKSGIIWCTKIKKKNTIEPRLVVWAVECVFFLFSSSLSDCTVIPAYDASVANRKARQVKLNACLPTRCNSTQLNWTEFFSTGELSRVELRR
jgi:hypothetical protein